MCNDSRKTVSGVKTYQSNYEYLLLQASPSQTDSSSAEFALIDASEYLQFKKNNALKFFFLLSF